MAAAALITVPAFVLEFAHLETSHALAALLFGLAIVGAAFAISWAAETAQLDISAGLAIAILALIAVLPEYAVDFVYTAAGGNAFQADPSCPPAVAGAESPCDLALANMTGANRLLIGIGWSMVVFIAWYRIRRTGALPKGQRWAGIRLSRDHSIELGFLWIATLYSLTLPL